MIYASSICMHHHVMLRLHLRMYVCIVCMHVCKSSHRLSFTICHSRGSHSKIISKLIRIYVCTVQSNAVMMNDDIV